ncbi:hypothetical protein [Candidatus Lokiarchaeum ossiferum]|uniref:hypothetical protein n=1 Tax=Candidatus Lokiarchaeum ossiferum TaxID=2951803 RepID=UPI00352DDD64
MTNKKMCTSILLITFTIFGVNSCWYQETSFDNLSLGPTKTPGSLTHPASLQDAEFLPEWRDFYDANYENNAVQEYDGDGHPQINGVAERNNLNINLQDNLQFSIFNGLMLQTTYYDVYSWAEVSEDTANTENMHRDTGFNIRFGTDSSQYDLNSRFFPSKIYYFGSVEDDFLKFDSGNAFTNATFSHTEVVLDQNSAEEYAFHTSVTYEQLAINPCGKNICQSTYNLEVTYYLVLHPTEGNLRMHFRLTNLDKIRFSDDGEIITTNNGEPTYQLDFGFSADAINIDMNNVGQEVGGIVSSLTQISTVQETTTSSVQMRAHIPQGTNGNFTGLEIYYVLPDIQYNKTTTVEFDTTYPLSYEQITLPVEQPIDQSRTDETMDESPFEDFSKFFSGIPGYSHPLLIGVSLLACTALAIYKKRTTKRVKYSPIFSFFLG